ncbi:ABC transporter ATP-binding protein [Mesorhizobium sp. M8A.F.Ca.ET.173.01.1.1]|nr:ABC transporter ATP-binding protein [Mesorhizobium sp. M8A.F.Ca.ET.173.01.1.1]
MTSPLLQLKNISLSFKGIKVLRDLSFDVGRGEVCALIGPNGAGKSSLLNIITRVYHADAGEIVFDGKALHTKNPVKVAQLGIGRTFQHNALFNRLTVRENVLAGMTRHSRTNLIEHAFGLPRDHNEAKSFRKRANELVDMLDLTSFRDVVVSTLPYGVQKRVDLARALVGKPLLVLLDEPLAGMDHSEKRRMARYIADANLNLGTTVVLIEHDIGMVMDLSHHVVVLDYGKKVGDGRPDEVRRNPEVIAAYLGPAYQEAV